MVTSRSVAVEGPMPTKNRLVLMSVLVALASALLLFLLPRRIHERVGPLRRVSLPVQPLVYPHPVAQIAEREPNVTEAYVSDFLDLGHSTRFKAVATSYAPARLYYRSAHRRRSFLIRHARPADSDFLRWQPIDADVYAARRFVQFVAVAHEPSQVASDGMFIDVEFDRRSRLIPWIVVGAIMLAAVGFGWSQINEFLRRNYLAIMAWTLASAVVLCLWDGRQVQGDETYVFELARSVLDRQDYRIAGFNYPHPLVYFQVLATALFGVLRATFGLAYHDPYSNQLLFDGEPLPRRLFAPEFFPNLFYVTALPWIRRCLALIPALSVLAAFRIVRRVATPRAGLFAAMALAVQPLLMRTEILPNTTSVLLVLLGIELMLSSTAGYRALMTVGLIAGLSLGFKYNPTLPLVATGILWFDWPWARRGRATIVVLASIACGFLACYPTLFSSLRAFMTQVAYEAHHYGNAGHPHFEVDSVLPSVLHGAYFWSRLAGNYVVLALLAIGILSLALRAARGERRVAFVLFSTLIVSYALMYRQFVQFGRNFAIPLAVGCLFAGVGAEALLGLIERHSGRWRLSAWAALILAGAILSVGVRWRIYQRAGRLIPTAREQAIAWVDRNVEIGSRVALIEPLVARIQGILPDQARFRVRCFDALPEDKPFSVLVMSSAMGGCPVPNAVASFTGPSVWGGGSEHYCVIKNPGL
jgi:hypothetical protein